MIAINLLVTGQAAPRTVRPILNAVLLIATAAALAGHGWYLDASRTTLLARSVVFDAQLAEARSSAKRVDAARKRHAELVTELAIVNHILGGRTTSAELFEAISRSLTDGLWLTEVKQSAATVQLEGRASSLAAIVALVRNLGANVSFVRPPEIRTMSAEALDGTSILRFQVGGELAPGLDERRP